MTVIQETDLTDDAAMLMESQFRHCTKLDLSGSPLSTSVIEQIVRWLPENLEELRLSSTQLTDEAAAFLAPKLHYCDTINLGHCSQLTFKGLQEIIRALPKHLKNVNFSYINCLNEKSVELLIKKIKRCIKLNVSGCIQLLGPGLTQIVQALPNNIQEISARNLMLREEDISLICSKLGRCTQIDLGNCTNSIEQIRTIINSLPDNIQRISLDELELTDAIVPLLVRKLQQCVGLNLNVCNQLSDHGMQQIMECLPENIEWLSLDETALTAQGASFLKSKLKQCKTLSLANCTSLTADGLQMIASGLSENIEKLNLANTPLVNRGAAILSPKLKHCTQLSLVGSDELSADLIAEVIKNLPNNIVWLYLAGTNLMDTGAFLLEPKLRFCKHLSIANCTSLSHEGVRKIVQGLSGKIESLFLDCTNLTDSTALLIAPKLQSCLRLSLSDCTQLSRDGLRDIIDGISRSIESLNLDNTALTDREMLALENKLGRENPLPYVTIDNTQVSNVRIERIRDQDIESVSAMRRKGDIDALATVATHGKLLSKEIAYLVKKIENAQVDDPDLAVLIYALGQTHAREYRNLIEKFLNYPSNPCVSARALQVLCLTWGYVADYSKEIKFFINGVNWDKNNAVKITAMLFGGTLARKNRDREIIKYLLNTYEDQHASTFLRAIAYEALARAAGIDLDKIPDHDMIELSLKYNDSDLNIDIIKEMHQLTAD